jgi:hypothetical protein
MVEFTLDKDVKEMWTQLIDDFKFDLEKLYESGNLIFVSTAENKEKAWTIIKCGSESELLFLLDDFQIVHYCTYTYTELALVQSAHELPIVCLN